MYHFNSLPWDFMTSNIMSRTVVSSTFFIAYRINFKAFVSSIDLLTTYFLLSYLSCCANILGFQSLKLQGSISHMLSLAVLKSRIHHCLWPSICNADSSNDSTYLRRSSCFLVFACLYSFQLRLCYESLVALYLHSQRWHVIKPYYLY